MHTIQCSSIMDAFPSIQSLVLSPFESKLHDTTRYASYYIMFTTKIDVTLQLSLPCQYCSLYLHTDTDHRLFSTQTTHIRFWSIAKFMRAEWSTYQKKRAAVICQVSSCRALKLWTTYWRFLAIDLPFCWWHFVQTDVVEISRWWRKQFG